VSRYHLPAIAHGVADSVLVGAGSCFLSVLSFAATLLVRAHVLHGETVSDAAFAWICASPIVALVNLAFVARDNAAGRRWAAVLGLALSGISVFIGVLPIALAD
jgi:hypothetical protein